LNDTHGNTSDTHAEARLRAARAALSELFLDTELDGRDLARIAQVVTGTGLRRDELEHVFTDELEPLLAGNLNVPAGEWQGFDIEWIEAQIRERAGQGTVRKAIGRAMRAVRGASAARADWDRLKALLAAKEA
jgi:hypothetical protein